MKLTVREGDTMFKCRVTCVVIAVLGLVGLALTLYVPETPHLPAAWFFAYTCIAGLLGNWIVSMVELHQAKKEYRAGKKHETTPENRL